MNKKVIKMNELKKIAVIGCGQVGRRHIQGLGQSESKLEVHIYDRSSESLETCKVFFNAIANEVRNINFSFYNNLDDLGKASALYNLTIIASTADERPKQIKSILANVNAKNWLLEKPLAQSAKELDDLELSLSGLNVWINHFRRTVPWHQELQKLYFNNQQVEIIISGSEIGIGCNISHLVDLVNYWSEEVPIDVNVSGLNNPWHHSKRKGFREADGKLDITFSQGSTLQVISDGRLGKLLIIGKFRTTGIEFSIDETNAIALIGENVSVKGQMIFQSQITGMVFDQLEKTGTCNLTPLNIAAKCYRPVIEGLLSHWQSTTEGLDNNTVPLT